MLLAAEYMFDGQSIRQNTTVEIQNERIVAIHDEVLPNAKKLNGTLTAGFIDYQVNGGGGQLFNTTPNIATLDTMVTAHCQFGTTAILPTLITDNLVTMQQAADTVAEAMSISIPGIAGIHFEGPHLSLAKKGVHSAKYIRELTSQEQQLFCREDLGVRVVTVAPESIQDQDIALLVKNGVKVSIGHSNTSFDRCNRAIKAGVDGFTHLFNAMSPLNSREPGVVGAAIADNNCWCGIILDGHHVHYGTAKLAYQAKPLGKLLLVTDAMSTIGSDQIQFDLFGQQVTLNKDKLTTQDGTLAGSALTMIQAVKNAVQQLSIPLEHALNMASYFPAQYLGVENKMGIIKVGHQADVIVFDANFNVSHTWIKGELRFCAE